MSKKRIDILRQHQRAIDDLAQIGVIDTRVMTMIDIYRARKVVGLTNGETAQTFKCSKRTITRTIGFLETEI